MKNSDMPAMPFEIVDEVQSSRWWSGMTKREMMAMHMMASIITQGAPAFIHAAEDAVNAADALLAELERTK